MTDTPPRLRINRLKIENYKKIDHLEIEFPLPLMEGDPDIFVLGSKNGGGKTSVLECCALATLSGLCQKFSVIKNAGFELLKPIVRASQNHLKIDATFSINHPSQGQNVQCSVVLDERHQSLHLDGYRSNFQELGLTEEDEERLYPS